MNKLIDRIAPELELTTARSSGPGGQNVNKVASKVILRFNITHSEVLSEIEKAKLQSYLKNKLTNDGDLIIMAEENRSQLRNKKLVFQKLASIIQSAFFRPKKRKPTNPTKASVQKRLKTKKMQAEKKKWRKLG